MFHGCVSCNMSNRNRIYATKAIHIYNFEISRRYIKTYKRKKMKLILITYFI